MAKIIRLTESDLVRLVKRVIKEQSTPQDYKEIADYLYSNMKGLSSSQNSKNVEEIIFNRIKNRADWEGVKKAFGLKDGENLEQWLKGEMRIDLNDIMTIINSNDARFKEQDAIYNVGAKIQRISNRQFLMSRAYNYSSTIGNELDTELRDCSVIRRDKDGIVVKCGSVSYYKDTERKTGEYPKEELMSNVCVKIPFKEIIEFRDNVLQVKWLANFVTRRIVPC